MQFLVGLGTIQLPGTDRTHEPECGCETLTGQEVLARRAMWLRHSHVLLLRPPLATYASGPLASLCVTATVVAGSVKRR